ncbi:GIY-YIG nuclease family protein [Gallibacterium melopsittaci]|uniref:GIY-YIG nuclease family protein n=1 Tax=Gallibacterium melopsittaci TaxID=516063 RepID=A0ABV6HUT6_9PAST
MRNIMHSTKHPTTIQIFLPSGDPSGIRVAEQTTSIMRLIEVPRAVLSDFLHMDEARQVGVYFLIGGADNDEVYIGQSGEVGKRIDQHHREDKKDWSRALVLISLTKNLTQTHALYLENLAIDTATKCTRFNLVNNNKGQKPHTPAPLKADCHAMFDIASLLLTTLGYPIFESLVKSENTHQQAIIFHCPRGNVDAQAIYTQEGMIVLKGSNFPYINKDEAKDYRHKMIDFCHELINKGVLEYDEKTGRCTFAKDYRFNSPSAATGLLLLTSTNGWTEFKTREGKTLKEVYVNSSGANDE